VSPPNRLACQNAADGFSWFMRWMQNVVAIGKSPMTIAP
jgi:hypothetical protein